MGRFIEKLVESVRRLAGVIAGAIALLAIPGQPALAATVELNLAPYANRNIQANLFPTFPTGQIVPPKNSFGVPFYIPDRGNNFIAIDTGPQRTPLTLHVGVSGVRKVYTLMQAYGPYPRHELCKVTFVGSAGARQTFSLVCGDDVRDFFESNFARTINHTSTRPAFACIGRGGAYTNDTRTGPQGFYNFDEQVFKLDPSFARQTLVAIGYTVAADFGGPILLGLTAVTNVQSNSQVDLINSSRFHD